MTHQGGTLQKQPNILLLWTDQQRADTMACYGNHVIHTPNLNLLSQQSFVFKNAYCTQSLCTPARASLVTGLWPHKHKAIQNSAFLDSNLDSIGEIIPDSYNKAYFGKWHLGDEFIAQRGFREWLSIEDYHDYRINVSKPEYSRLHSGYHKFLINAGYPADKRTEDGLKVHSREFCAVLPPRYTKSHFLSGAAQQFLSEQTPNKPFFLSVSFLEPHPPMFSAYNDVHDPDSLPVSPAFMQIPKENTPEYLRKRATEFIETGFKNFDLSTENDWRRLMANYYGVVSLVDEAIGSILAKLAELGLEENTIVVFTSDHGEMLGDHMLLKKGVMYEPAIKIPFMIRVPWLSKQQNIIQERINHLDLIPTLLDIIEEPSRTGLDGISLLNLLHNPNKALERNMFVEWNDVYEPDKIGRTIIAPENWKLTVRVNGQNELYDLNSDPYELDNKFFQAQYGNITDELIQRLADWQNKVSDTIGSPIQ